MPQTVKTDRNVLFPPELMVSMIVLVSLSRAVSVE